MWKYAFDISRLRPHVIGIDTNVRVQVDPEQRDALRKRVRDGQRVYMLSKRDLTAERQNGGTSVL